jgi:hypothetical protein
MVRNPTRRQHYTAQYLYSHALEKLWKKIASKRISVEASRCGAISRSQFGNKVNHQANDALFKTLAGVCPSLLPPHFRNSKFIS